MSVDWQSFTRAIIVCLCVAVGGCSASYATPGRGANMSMFAGSQLQRDAQTDGSVVDVINKRPLANLPTPIAVVRVQAPGYHSATSDGWGTGAYCVVTSRDIDQMDDVLGALLKLPMIEGLAPLNRLLLPAEFHSDLELRQAAAALHADMLLIYTLDTTFEVEDVVAPLTVVTLGLSPNQVAHVSCTASAVIMDTRNGYVYGIAEATDRQQQLASAWTSQAAVDQTRRRVESTAFKRLGDNLQITWAGVVNNHSLATR
ncbi:MAG TPA: hypothetical protein VK797_16945 [Tepidisphaeraceae bacterium]|nr:hypothetical protein [Tepidisphaeraceae bacterium]